MLKKAKHTTRRGKPNPDGSPVGELVKRLFGDHGVTQQDVADALGTSLSQICFHCTGGRPMTFATAAKLTYALDLTRDEQDELLRARLSEAIGDLEVE